MAILVTGGAGFIGSAVVRHIIESTQDSVVNVDKLTYAGNLESLESVENNSRYVFEQVDICDAKAVARVFEHYQPDAVMHLAAESHVDRSISPDWLADFPRHCRNIEAGNGAGCRAGSSTLVQAERCIFPVGAGIFPVHRH